MLARKKILILGAGAWQTPYILTAKTLGLKVFATDWESDAQGAKYADVFQPINLLNKERTLAFAKKNAIEAIFTSADIGVPTAAYVAEAMGLRYHSQRLALMATNKFLMREHAKKIGLSIPEFALTENAEEANLQAIKIGYPVIIKPVDNCSSRGVYYVNNETELMEKYAESMASSFSKKVLIEEFMLGTEGSIECVVKKGRPVILGICDKVKSELPYRYDLQLNYPGNYSVGQYLLIEEFIEKLVKGFAISHGIIHVEIAVEAKRIRLIEFAIRGCGSKVVTHLLPAMTGFAVPEYLLYDSFGIERKSELKRSDHGILKFIMLKKGTVKKISGLAAVKKIAGVIDIAIERKAGDRIDEIKDGRSRPGYLLAVAKSKSQLDEIVAKAFAAFSVEII
jgi:formate-dependent phosphoribosylglycinamide formyltransferase (GAR transformylase)